MLKSWLIAVERASLKRASLKQASEAAASLIRAVGSKKQILASRGIVVVHICVRSSHTWLWLAFTANAKPLSNFVF